MIETKTWKSDPFQFRRGVFQGDPISPILFLMVFNPIILDLQNQAEKVGYKLGDFSYVTLPYADDFCLITTHMRTHKNLISEINKKIVSMGMRLKQENVGPSAFPTGRPRIFPSTSATSGSPVFVTRSKNSLGRFSFSLESLRRYFPS